MNIKKQRRPDERPDEILDAATLVFANQGFDAARMDEIAEHAGLSKGALYLYFKSKDAILIAIIDRFATRNAARAFDEAERIFREDPAKAMEQVLRIGVMISSDAQSSLVPRLVIAEATRFPAIAESFRETVIARMLATLHMVLTEGVRQGVFRYVQTDSAARFIFGPIIAHTLLTHVFNKPGEAALAPHTFGDELITFALQGLRPL